MKPILRTRAILFLVAAAGCEWPFSTTPTSDEPIFQVTAVVSTERLITSGFVDLGWPLVGIDNFQAFHISRRFALSQDSALGSWKLLATITDSRVNTWRDTIYDDEILRYQVAVFRSDGTFGASEVEAQVPTTTRIVVPEDFTLLADAALSPIMDDGDTILVGPGHYDISGLKIAGKGLVIIGTEGADETFLERGPLASDSIMIQVEGGLLQGFTIEAGIALTGGGIYAGGSAVLRHLILRSNQARVGLVQPWGGWGGGAYLFDLARMENCLIFSNSATKQGGGVYIDPNSGRVRIVNCTIYGNTAVGQFTLQPESAGGGIWSQNGFARVENCLVVNNGNGNIMPLPPDIFAPQVLYTGAGPDWAALGSTNLAAEPEFVNPAVGNFRLQPGSPGIDAGNPDPAFNDPDGSRNDMGAYGGPHGNW